MVGYLVLLNAELFCLGTEIDGEKMTHVFDNDCNEFGQNFAKYLLLCSGKIP